jgi:stress response protein YsnF
MSLSPLPFLELTMSPNTPSDDTLTAEDEAALKEYQDWLDEQESQYEERVRASYRARGLGNIY